MVTACYGVGSWPLLPPVVCLWATGFRGREQAMGYAMTSAGMYIAVTKFETLNILI